MRTREEVKNQLRRYSMEIEQEVKLELLLDVRELLFEIHSDIHIIAHPNKARVKEFLGK